MNSIEHRKRKKRLHLTEEQRHILVGLLLGDGHLETQNDGRTYRLKVEHSFKQKDYVEWLYRRFKNWIPGGMYEKNRENGQKSVGFTTFSHGAFRFYAQQFYQNKKKVIPKLISKILHPLSVAVWFLDDGSRKSRQHKTYILHTLGFSKQSLRNVQDALKKRCSIETMLHKQKSKYWRLYIPSSSVQKFETLVLPLVQKFQSMKHKIGNTLPKE